MQNVFLPKLPIMLNRRMESGLMFTVGISLFYMLQLAFSNQSGLFSNLVIPDGVNLHEASTALVSGLLNADDLQPGFGAFAFYYPFKWCGMATYFCMNLFCLLVIGWRLGFTSIMLFPYFVVAAALPSKDILVLLMALFFIISLVNGRLLVALLVALLSYFIRDGSLFVLMAIFAAYQINQRNIIKPYLLVALAFICGAFIFVILPDVFGDVFIVSRNLDVYEKNALSLLGNGTSFDYFVRVFGNATNLAFRPSVIDGNGGISVVGLVYFISGISMLTSLFCSVSTIAYSKNKRAVNLSVALLVSLAVISINPFIQGRYLLTFCVVLLGYLINSGGLKNVLKMYFISVVVTIFAIVAYAYSNIPGTEPNAIIYFTFFS